MLSLRAFAVLIVQLERWAPSSVPFAPLAGTVAVGLVVVERREHLEHRISAKLSSIWVLAEIVLFVLAGAQIDVSLAWSVGALGACVIACGLLARRVGVFACLTRSAPTWGERLFAAISYLPKATVQAAVGASPLIAVRTAGTDTEPQQVILAMPVLSILMTSPLGAWAISMLGERVLEVGDPGDRDSYDAAVESEG